MSDTYSYASIRNLGADAARFSFDKCSDQNQKASALEDAVEDAQRELNKLAVAAERARRDYEYVRTGPDQTKAWDYYHRYLEAHKAWEKAGETLDKLKGKLKRAWQAYWDCEQSQYKPDKPYAE